MFGHPNRIQGLGFVFGLGFLYCYIPCLPRTYGGISAGELDLDSGFEVSQFCLSCARRAMNPDRHEPSGN